MPHEVGLGVAHARHPPQAPHGLVDRTVDRDHLCRRAREPPAQRTAHRGAGVGARVGRRTGAEADDDLSGDAVRRVRHGDARAEGGRDEREKDPSWSAQGGGGVRAGTGAAVGGPGRARPMVGIRTGGAQRLRRLCCGPEGNPGRDRTPTTKGVSVLLAITAGAEEALAKLRDSVDDLPPEGGIRISQETDEEGDAGFTLELVESAEDDDVVLEGHALPVFVDPEAAELLDGTALDGEAHGDHVHFGFVAVGDQGDFGHGPPSPNGNGPAA